MGFFNSISRFFGHLKVEGSYSRAKVDSSRSVSELVVPWERDLPPEKRRFWVHSTRTGGMGIVYLVLDKQLYRPYAIKTFQDQFLKSSDAVNRFKREAQAWVELGKHKNIVQAEYVQTHLGRPYVFMEWVKAHEEYGANLQEWIQGGGLDVDLTINLAIQFCRGMSHAEKRFKEKGMTFVHRDIKPANILITQEVVAKITDFGLVYSVKDEDSDSGFVVDKSSGWFGVMSQQRIPGTLFFMSPEQILQGPLDIRSDMYSFGCTLYAMVKGAPPFYEPTHSKRLCFHRTLSKRPEAIHSGNQRFDELIMTMLQKNPDDRGFGSFAQLELALLGMPKHYMGQYLREDPNEELTAWELVNSGISFTELGDFERAIQKYDRALELSPRYALAYLNRGAVYDKLDQPERAIEDYKKALEIDSGDPLAYLNLGTAYDKLGEFERAIDNYNKALEINPRYAQVYWNRGLHYDELGQFHQAIDDFNKALDIDSSYADAFVARAVTYNRLNEPNKAIEDCTRAIELNPRFAEAYLNRGFAYGKLGQIERAIEDYDDAIELNPGYAKAYNNRGNARTKLGQIEKAIEDYSMAIELKPDYARAYNNRGNAYCETKEPWQAIDDFSQSLALNPDDAATYLNRGLTYQGLGKFREAVADWRRFVQIAPPEYASQVAQIQEAIRELEEQLR